MTLVALVTKKVMPVVEGVGVVVVVESSSPHPRQGSKMTLPKVASYSTDPS